jgi:hypothetical protein
MCNDLSLCAAALPKGGEESFPLPDDADLHEYMAKVLRDPKFN